MTVSKNNEWGILFDLDETLVLTSVLDPLRKGRKWKQVYSAFGKTRLPNGTLEFLQRLSQKARLGVVTKAPRSYAERLLLYHDVKIPVVAAYHDVKNVKPHPEALLLAAQRLGIEASKCIYVGDDATDVQAARSAHFIPVGVCWGNRVDIGLSSICTTWNQVYDEILRLIPG